MAYNSRNIKREPDPPEEEGPGLFGKILIGLGVGVGLGALAYVAYNQLTATPTEYLFHYTTRENADRIHRTRRIKKSVGGKDCAYGEGVYLTSLLPTEGREKIIENNYRIKNPQGTTHRRSDNANCFFRFNQSALPSASKIEEEVDRSIWVCPHEIELNKVDYVWGEIDANVVLKYHQRTGALTSVDFTRI